MNAKGESIPVRWWVKPDQTPVTENSATGGKNYLFDALLAQLHSGPLRWHLIAHRRPARRSHSGSSVDVAEDRQQIDVGTVTIDTVESEDTSPTRDINFDPLILPDGISPSDDPLLSARSAAYSQSFTRREGEHKSPSAVSTAEVAK